MSLPELERFADSRALTMGVELELQIVNRHDYDLSPSSPDLLRLMGKHKLPGSITPRSPSSMIELCTGVCDSHSMVLDQLIQTRDALVESADRLNLGLSGGGTHPFQHWSERRIYDKPRFHEVSALYGYLAKQFTIFGQHVHIGCPGPDQALVLLHGLSRFIPHLIALSAASPFVQGTDTGFHSRAAQLGLRLPALGPRAVRNDLGRVRGLLGKMTRTGVVKSMKDFYWDIRPKPEYGTIEVRVLDTPLTVEKAAALAGFIQCLARWLAGERPFEPQEDDYLPYTFNRFQAAASDWTAPLSTPAQRAPPSARRHHGAVQDAGDPRHGTEGRARAAAAGGRGRRPRQRCRLAARAARGRPVAAGAGQTAVPTLGGPPCLKRR